MKASEIIQELQESITHYGDNDVFILTSNQLYLITDLSINGEKNQIVLHRTRYAEGEVIKY